jgi:hypothetical protein
MFVGSLIQPGDELMSRENGLPEPFLSTNDFDGFLKSKQLAQIKESIATGDPYGVHLKLPGISGKSVSKITLVPNAITRLVEDLIDAKSQGSSLISLRHLDY